jgi:hypothetical protein
MRVQMKKVFGGGSQNRWFSVLLLPIIIPLWVIGWILYTVGLEKDVSKINTTKNNNCLNKEIMNKSEKEKVEQPIIQ